jgi:alpha-beta hydrolase superfamily lysophospholipase
MKTPKALLAAALLFAAVPALAGDAQQRARQLIEQLQAGQYNAAQAQFSPEMAAALPASRLAQVWQALGQQLGPLQDNPGGEVVAANGMQVVTSQLHFANGALKATTAIDAQGRIAGFHVAPAHTQAAAPPADAPYTESELQLHAGPGPLGATLATPKGEGPFPALVLVHGSGPQDRDETVGPNRPFADIARGLAAQGIAVLRYDKRTQARAQDFANGASLALEVSDDAIAAVHLLRGLPAIDTERVYVLGHSQGAMLAARIASAAKARGAVLMAAPARPILDLLREQNVHLLAQQAAMAEGDKQAHLSRLDASIAALRSDADAELLGLPGSYWQEVEAVDVIAEATASGLPLLVLHGGRDFQVTDADYALLQQGLPAQRSTFHRYPALDHLGIAGTGPSTLEQYQQPGAVDGSLINDIATWIKQR